MAFERNPELPPLPRFKWDSVQLGRETLERVFSEYRDQRMTPELALRMAVDANKALPDVPETNLHQTFVQYTGQGIDEKLVHVLDTQVAGRETELFNGPIVSYDKPTKCEWVAMEVLKTEETVWRSDQPGTLFHFGVFSGHPAGHVLKRKFPNGWLNFFAYRLGFSRQILWDYDVRHFIGLRLWGYLKPTNTPGEIQFDDWDLSVSFKKHNYTVIKLRTRFDYEKAECPAAYEHTCFECHVGRDKCPASSRLISIPQQQNSAQQNTSG